MPSHKTYCENTIVNRGCLAKQCAGSALWVESILIPNAIESENRIFNRGSLCPMPNV